MSDIKISALPGASTLTGAETIPVVQGGVTKKVTTDQFLTKDASGNVGVGTASPAAKLEVSGSQNGLLAKFGATTTGRSLQINQYAVAGMSEVGYEISSPGASGVAELSFATNGTRRATIDGVGNLGLGVTPSAWGSFFKAIQVGDYAAFAQKLSNATAIVASNAYNDDNVNWRYTVGSVPAARYEAGLGDSGAEHRWYTAPSGTAGNPISFTQVMTLDASGNLGVGTASPSAKLDVASDEATTALRVTTASNQNYQLRIGYRSASLSGEIQAIHVGTAYSDLMLQRDGGNVLVGASGNLLVGTTSAVEKLTLTGRAFLADQAAPATPTGGGVIYVEAGALKYKGSSGTVTILAAA